MQPCKDKNLNGKVYRCFFELTLQVMGGKWKPIILYHLAVEGVMRFSELRRGINGVTERMLARQLRELEADGIVSRKVYREVPPRVEYSLTDLGKGLVPILKDLRDWGADYERRMGGPELFTGEGYERDEDEQAAG
ncbi:MAG: winged helix-turn-helix transcriptional regulator [Thermodesulfobacteriota bacterium]